MPKTQAWHDMSGKQKSAKARKQRSSGNKEYGQVKPLSEGIVQVGRCGDVDFLKCCEAGVLLFYLCLRRKANQIERR